MMQNTEVNFITESKLNPKQTKHFEGAFAQGSGYLHIRGSYEEGLECAPQDERYMRLPANVTIEKPRHPRSKCGTYIPGITGIHPMLKEEVVNLPNPLCFYVEAEGMRLDMDTCVIEDYERRLELRTGVLERSFLWNLGDGKKLYCRYERYVSRSEKNLIVQKISYRAQQGDINLELSHDIDEKVTTNGYQHLTEKRKKAVKGGYYVEVETDNGDRVRMVSRAAADGHFFEQREGESSAGFILRVGETVQIQKMTAVSSSRDLDGFRTEEELSGELDTLWSEEEKVYEDHVAEWGKMWKKSEVCIEGDDEAQRALNFSIYHLLRCGNEKDSRAAICAKGFSGEAYFGHFFWDTEIYMLPFFLYTAPQTAKMLEEFRIRTLPGARKNAAEYGYPGARYPWESSVSGEEQCPNWQYADHEIHVTADVVFGLWHYYQNTGDPAFLREAAPVFLETSRYWMERVCRSADGSVHINGVMGPDEYVCFCDDNAYTNYMAAFALKTTCRIFEILEEQYPDIREKLGFDVSECAGMEATAENIVICKKDDGIWLQCRHFEELEEPEFERFWTDRSSPFGQFVSQERNYRIKALKQADVLMLFYLFGKKLSEDEMEANYDYYLPYTTHDSSLSRIIHSILCCRRGKADEAYRFFQDSSKIDLDEEHAGAAEGIHIANCGGIWQAVIFGFAGMSRAYESDVPEFRPVMPQHWKKISFPLFYRGEEMYAEVTQGGVWINGKKYEPRT